MQYGCSVGAASGVQRVQYGCRTVQTLRGPDRHRDCDPSGHHGQTGVWAPRSQCHLHLLRLLRWLLRPVHRPQRHAPRHGRAHHSCPARRCRRCPTPHPHRLLHSHPTRRPRLCSDHLPAVRPATQTVRWRRGGPSVDGLCPGSNRQRPTPAGTGCVQAPSAGTHGACVSRSSSRGGRWPGRASCCQTPSDSGCLVVWLVVL